MKQQQVSAKGRTVPCQCLGSGHSGAPRCFWGHSGDGGMMLHAPQRAQSQGSLLSLPCRPRRRIQHIGHRYSVEWGLRRGPCGWSGPSSLHSPVGPIAGTILGQPSLENPQGGESGRGRPPT